MNLQGSDEGADAPKRQPHRTSTRLLHTDACVPVAFLFSTFGSSCPFVCNMALCGNNVSAYFGL